MSVNDVLEAVRAMSADERARVRSPLDTLAVEPQSLEEQAQHSLYEAGLLAEIHPRHAIATPRRTPVPIRGKPLSETVIEERG